MAVSKPSVFISYDHDDKSTAHRLAEGLRGHSFHVWTDELLSPGENWAAEMATALGKADAMVVLLSPNSVKSQLVRRDVEYALSSPRFEHRLIPVIIGGDSSKAWLKEAPWVLRKLEMVSSSNASDASKRVANVLEKPAEPAEIDGLGLTG